jgi:hypothetical protein
MRDIDYYNQSTILSNLVIHLGIINVRLWMLKGPTYPLYCMQGYRWSFVL